MAAEQLVVAKEFISTENLNVLFNFTVHMDIEDTGNEGTSSAKRMKIELCGELSKNELFCTTLREMVKVKELIIDRIY